MRKWRLLKIRFFSKLVHVIVVKSLYDFDYKPRTAQLRRIHSLGALRKDVIL